MAEITADDVTVNIMKKLHGMKGNRLFCKVEYGDGALTYPAGGVPLPASGVFGLPRYLGGLTMMESDSTQAMLVKYDLANHKVRHFYPTQQTAGQGDRAGVELSGAIPATVLYVEVEGW